MDRFRFIGNLPKEWYTLFRRSVTNVQVKGQYLGGCQQFMTVTVQNTRIEDFMLIQSRQSLVRNFFKKNSLCFSCLPNAHTHSLLFFSKRALIQLSRTLNHLLGGGRCLGCNTKCIQRCILARTLFTSINLQDMESFA